MNLGGTIRLNRAGFVFVCCFALFLFLYVASKSDPGAFQEAPRVSLRELLTAAVEAAERGGYEVFRVKKDKVPLEEKSKGKTKEGADSLVTNADYRSHCVMYTGLRNAFPSVKVISEEKDPKCRPQPLISVEKAAGMDQLQEQDDDLVDPAKLLVWIDPLDATQEFTEDILDCVTTMVCVVYNGNPIIGVIHKPFGTEPKTSWVWLNRGKSPNLKFPTVESNGKTIIVSRSHPGEVEKRIKDALGNDVNIVHAGGAGYKVLQVASGNASAYVHVTAIKKWDICAGDAVATALGGRMSTLDNRDIDYANRTEETDQGILVTMRDHDAYVEKFRKASP